MTFVEIYGFEKYLKARKWLRDNFIEEDQYSVKTYEPYNTNTGGIPDLYYFWFKSEDIAMAFKLRWS